MRRKIFFSLLHNYHELIRPPNPAQRDAAIHQIAMVVLQEREALGTTNVDGS